MYVYVNKISILRKKTRSILSLNQQLLCILYNCRFCVCVWRTGNALRRCRELAAFTSSMPTASASKTGTWSSAPPASGTGAATPGRSARARWSSSAQVAGEKRSASCGSRAADVTRNVISTRLLMPAVLVVTNKSVKIAESLKWGDDLEWLVLNC